MRWNALGMVTLLVGLGMVGCTTPKKDGKELQSVDAYDYTLPMAYEPVAPVPSVAMESETSIPPMYQPEPAVELSSMDASIFATARYHTVAKGDTLYSIARRYYDDHHRWKDIYQANQGEVGNPDMIRVGQRLVIP